MTMGQSAYADTFINSMLGWIRSLANGIANMFQAGGSSSSMGGTLLDWFAGNWLKLLVVLIVLGIIIDWIVWMLRWRPYWLWFHKKRVLLDDDIDLDLDEDELRRRYARSGEDDDFDRRPHFQSSRYGMSGRAHAEAEATDDLDETDDYAENDPEPDLYEDYDEFEEEPADEYGRDEAEYYDGEDGLPRQSARGADYEGDYDDYDDYEDIEPRDGEAYEDEEEEEAYGEDYEDEDAQSAEDDFLTADEPYDYEDELDNWDTPPKKPKRARWTLGRKKAARAADADEDPFSVSDAEFDDPDDDFFSVVSEEPAYDALNPQDPNLDAGPVDTNVFKRPESDPKPPLDLEIAAEPIDPARDWHTGYSCQTTPVQADARPESRKARRRRMEGSAQDAGNQAQIEET